MELRLGQAVLYRDSSTAREHWAVLETVESTQISSDKFTGKELILARSLPKDSLDSAKYTGENEVFISTKEVTGLRSEVRKTKMLSDLRSYAKVREGFVWRRKMLADSGTLDPPRLTPVCECSELLNPDVAYTACESCLAIFHEKCVPGMSCLQCKAPLCPQKRTNSPVDNPPAKAQKTDVEVLIPERKQTHILQVNKYPLLTAIVSGDLQRRLVKQYEDSLSLVADMSEEDRVRHSLREKVVGALLLAQAEQKAQHPGAAGDFPVKSLSKTAKEVEIALFHSSSKTAKSQNYGRRARMIVFNLLDEKNPDFRANLLRGELKPQSLAYMESKDMASSSMKQLREERERRYLEEQLICPTTGAKLIVKTHKGEGVIDVGGEDRIVNNDSMDILDNLHERGKAEKGLTDPDEEDPFDPNSHCDTPKKLCEKPGTSVSPTTPASQRKPGVKPRIEELVRENSPEVLAEKIKKRLTMYLKPEQVESILKAASIE